MPAHVLIQRQALKGVSCCHPYKRRTRHVKNLAFADMPAPCPEAESLRRLRASLPSWGGLENRLARVFWTSLSSGSGHRTPRGEHAAEAS